MYKKTTYQYGTTPSMVPAGAQRIWDEEIAICLEECGEISIEDEELSMIKLVQDWNGHKSGSIIVTGLTIEGHEFFVVEKI